jgi:hypothetical protein
MPRHPASRRVRLLLSKNITGDQARLVKKAVADLPLSTERPIALDVRPELSAWRGRLLSGGAKGKPVYAAAFIRERRIVLETDLARDPGCLRAIVVHEAFHFVWARLGNHRRRSFESLLQMEASGHARGELGESAAVAKQH